MPRNGNEGLEVRRPSIGVAGAPPVHLSIVTGLLWLAVVSPATSPALADCNQIGVEATCTGDLSDGVAFDFYDDGIEILNINDLTAPIAPAAGIVAVELTATGANGSSSGDSGVQGFTTQLELDDSAGQGIVTDAAIGIEHTGNGGDGRNGKDDFDVFDADGQNGGSGGDGGLLLSFPTFSSVTVGGDGVVGIYIGSHGGDGGNGGKAENVVGDADGGNGGSGGIGGNIASRIIAVDDGDTIGTTGNESHAILIESIAGNGGKGGNATSSTSATGGKGGIGGDGGTVFLRFEGSATTSGDSAQALFVQSYGGAGGDGGSAGAIVSEGGAARGAGDGNTVTVTSQGRLATSGDDANAILVQSIGGFAGSGGSSGGFVAFGASSQSAGSGGTVDLTVTAEPDFESTITTIGDSSFAIHAQSIGGGGGRGSDDAGVITVLGSSGSAGGDGGAVTVVNGEGIATSGAGSTALLAQSVGGGGGDGGNLGGIETLGTQGGSGGSGGAVSVDNSGAITTDGFAADGISAQSIGGGGGSTGASAGLVNLGGSGGDGGNGGAVSVVNSADIITLGSGSEDIAAAGVNVQSIGGGGGKAVGSITIDAIVAVTFNQGADGGDGGDGNEASYSDDGAGDYTITTSGDNANGVFVQSLGGGGGSGGYTTSVAADSFLTVELGTSGEGGAGGNGVTAGIDISGAVSTAGANAAALTAQSIGGGGGNGGNAVSISQGFAFDLTMTHGGPGGGGGSGGTATIDAGGAVTTSGDNSVGILAQSLGGGGGNGGSTVDATAASAVAVRLTNGGSGGGGGDGSVVEVSGAADIGTSGANSGGIVAQSIGGGGGNVGAIVAAAAATSMDVSVTNGGSGGGGGNGSAVTVDYDGDITTIGDQASAILAQSIGGGGGNGGTVVSGAANFGSVTVTNGGDGAAGGAGSNVTVISSGAISTTGIQSYGILAQSAGGGGGNGGVTIAGTLSALGEVEVTAGGDGGDGRQSGEVQVTNDGTVTTAGSSAHAISAQSHGGGGGNAKLVVGADAVISGATFFPPDIQVTTGGGGGGGGQASLVSVENDNALTTMGDHAYGIFAQSQGGDGGHGGFAATGTLFTGVDIPVSVAVTLGGDGGDGNTGGAVSVLNKGDIWTLGYESYGVYAQSLGGSGGVGGSAISTSVVASSDMSIAVDVDLAGDGGDGNVADNVTIANQGNVATNGFFSDAIFAQSIGGDGGHGGGSYLFELTIGEAMAVAVGASVGGNGGTGNNGAAVEISNKGTLTTILGGSSGIYGQSVGGGGGNAGIGSTMVLNPASLNTFTSVSLTVGIGGDGGAGGDGRTVNVANAGTIATDGVASNGIFAQSVGGGGGDGGPSAAFSNFFTVTGAWVPTLNLSLGGDGGAAGDGGDVSVDNSGAIGTAGITGYGIFAQSVGGGGGTGGYAGVGATAWITDDQRTTLDTVLEGIGSGYTVVNQFAAIEIAVGGDGGASGDGGAVAVTNSKTIATTGASATAIYAQSVGGGGGSGGDAGAGLVSFFAFSGGGQASGEGGAVTVDTSGAVSTGGAGAIGVIAQSVGGGGGAAGDFEASLDMELASLETGLGIESAIAAGGGNGDDVGVDVGESITTSGDQAHGIFAQSVGGGGGAKQLNTDGSESEGAWVIGSSGGIGHGSDVSVTTSGSGDVSVSGAGSTAIFAQSAGGFLSQTGDVTIEIGSAVSATGERGRAILAQSTGNLNVGTSGNGTISVMVTEEGSVSSETDTYETIAFLDGTGSNSLTNYGLIEREEDGAAGYLLRTDGIGTLTVDNHGEFNGSVLLGEDGASDVFNNMDGGLLGLGLDFNLADAAALSNAGAMSALTVGSIGTGFIDGAVSQSETGTLWTDLTVGILGFGTPEADLVTFSEDGATLAGMVTGNMVGLNLLLPGDSGSILIANSETGGVIDVTDLTAANSSTVAYGFEKTETSPGVDEELYLTYEADYTPASANLGAGHTAFANYFADLISGRIDERTAGLTDDLAWIEAIANQVLNARSSSDLIEVYQSYTPDFSAFAPTATSLSANHAFTEALYSCPAINGFESRFDFAHQGECRWLQVATRHSKRDTSHGYLSYEEAAFGLAGGFQRQVGPGLFAGGGMSYELVSLEGTLGSHGSGDRFQVGGVIKVEHDAWTLAAALTGGFGWYDLHREVMAAEGSVYADSTPETAFITAVVAAAYEFDLGSWYAKPSIGAAATYLHQGAFDESGADLYNMHVGSADVTAFSVNPAVEVGRDLTLQDGRSARGFVRAGLLATYQPNNDIYARFLAQPSGDGFTLAGPTDDLLADLAVAVDAEIKRDVSLRVAAQALVGKDFQSYGGLAKFRIGF